jgi:hypothetical protein
MSLSVLFYCNSKIFNHITIYFQRNQSSFLNFISLIYPRYQIMHEQSILGDITISIFNYPGEMNMPTSDNKDVLKSEYLLRSSAENVAILKKHLENCSDIVYRPLFSQSKAHVFIVFIDGLCDTKTLDEVVLKPLIFEEKNDELRSQFILHVMKEKLVAIAQTQTKSKFSEVVDEILKGQVAFIVEGETEALIADLKGYEKRGINEPTSENTVRGPRDAFTETLRVNTSLIRRRIRHSDLKMEALSIGKATKTDVVIAYMKGIATEPLVAEVRKRLKRIEIDGILESSYIEEFIEDFPYSPFPQIQNTERPDVVCSSLLEGKIAILIDNTPFVLIAPMTFWAGLQAAEDYYERYIYTTFIRWIRFILLNVAIFLPSLYVAVTTFHPQLIPTNLLISIASAREGVPFPAVIEALLMEFMFEGLREAGIRLPKPVGSAVSIVGALVIGQAAVQAGIISAPMVIVVASTGIASFSIPRYNLSTSLRLLRFPMLLVAGTFGLFGIVIGGLIMLTHLVSLRSFGVPYLSPIAPGESPSRRDVLMRSPRWSMLLRNKETTGKNKQRAAKKQKPHTGRGK